MNNAALILKHAKLKRVVFYVVVGFLLCTYFEFILVKDAKAHIVYLAVSVAIVLYILFMCAWSDSAIINREGNAVTAEWGAWPFRRVARASLDSFTLVTIALLRQDSTKFCYQLGLSNNDEPDRFRLISYFDIEEAWKNAVVVARYLDLPLCDLMLGGRIWRKDEIPKTLEKRESGTSTNTAVNSETFRSGTLVIGNVTRKDGRNAPKY